jgi:hypothetical protein
MPRYDEDPQPSCTNPQRLIIPPRPRASSERWDARRMLALALSNGYPSAGPEEIAHWRRRSGQAEALNDETPA